MSVYLKQFDGGGTIRSGATVFSEYVPPSVPGIQALFAAKVRYFPYLQRMALIMGNALGYGGVYASESGRSPVVSVGRVGRRYAVLPILNTYVPPAPPPGGGGGMVG